MKKFIAKTALNLFLGILFIFSLSTIPIKAEIGQPSVLWYNPYYDLLKKVTPTPTYTLATIPIHTITPTPLHTKTPTPTPTTIQKITTSPTPMQTPLNLNLSQNIVLTSDEKQLIYLINNARQQVTQIKLSPLNIDPDLVKWARIKSQDMINNNYFGHTSPIYGDASSMLIKAGVKGMYFGENIAKAPSISWANAGFLGSSIHRATMLNPGYTYVGVGVCYKDSTLYITELFSAR